MGQDQSTAVAGWTAAPAALDDKAANEVANLCEDLSRGEHEASDPTLVDKRGNAAVAVYVNERACAIGVWTCEVVLKPDGTLDGGGFGGGSGLRAEPTNTPVDVGGGGAADGQGGDINVL